VAEPVEGPSSLPAGIPGSELAGPFPVGEYAERLRDRLREFTRVQLVGEIVNLRTQARARVYFELRDSQGALPCAMWRNDWERLGAAAGTLSDGAQVVVAGGCDYYPGSATSSPSFSFQVRDLRVAGEGDLLVRVERLRRTLHQEGLFEPQKRLPRPLLPRTIGVVTGEGGKARDDVLAGLRRRGWAGRVVWAFAPVQDRLAANLISQALTDLASLDEVEVVIVARGGGSLTDLMAFCDEGLCRTVALLRVPVIASVGHHTDRTLIDDVAAVSCSTPTHAAEAAVLVHCHQARAELLGAGRRLSGHSQRAVLGRARVLARQARAPREHLMRERRRLHQDLRELRATARRRVATEGGLAQRALLVLERKRAAGLIEHAREAGVLRAAARRLALRAGSEDRRQALEHLALALSTHDPERTLERGYALVEDAAGELLASAADARRARRLRLRFHDGAVGASVDGDGDDAHETMSPP
jgi:exodeoxyribonuclease VII large subunit